MEHVGAFLAPLGLDVRAHARLTTPVKPPLGVIVIVDVDELPAATAAGELLLIANAGLVATC
jgi:hypothetical protein